MENTEGIDAFGESRRMSEYADQLRSWLGQAYQWQCIPYVMPSVLINSRYSPPQQIQQLLLYQMVMSIPNNKDNQT